VNHYTPVGISYSFLKFDNWLTGRKFAWARQSLSAETSLLQATRCALRCPNHHQVVMSSRCYSGYAYAACKFCWFWRSIPCYSSMWGIWITNRRPTRLNAHISRLPINV